MSIDPNESQQAFPPAPPAYPQVPLAPQAYAQPVPAYGQPVRPMKTTAMVLRICFLVVAALAALIAFSIGTLWPMIMAQAAATNPNAATLPPGFGKAVGAIIGLFGGLLPLIAGVGLLMKASWGRVFAIVAAIPLLISIPFGTIFGALVLFFMLRGGSSEGYEQLSRGTASY